MWPPTIMINKATALEDRHQTITWGAGQLGIAQGVLDAVADGLLEPTGDLIVFVCIWIDPVAFEETAVREATRVAVRRAIGMAVEGRDPDAALRSGGAPRRGHEPVLRGVVGCEDHRDPRASGCGCRLIRRSTPRGTRTRAGRSRRRSCASRPTPAWSGSEAATR